MLADEKPEFGEKLLEKDDPDLRSCLPSVVAGICSAKPQRGEELVDQYIEENRFDLVSAGLSALASQDFDYVQEKINELLEDQSPIPPELVVGLSQVVNGHWEDKQEWTESVLLTLLEDAESLDFQSVDALLLALPLHTDDSQNVSEEILTEVLNYIEERENLASEPHGVEYVIAEVAERDPERFVEYSLQRLENGYTGTSLLPTHLELDIERMREADGYDKAISRVCEYILDTDYHTPIVFADLTGCFPIEDISERLLPEIPDCSEVQLLRITRYCRQLPVTGTV